MTDSPTPSGWTDHGHHDPGLTLLQVLLYTLGTVGLVAVSAAMVRRRPRWSDRDGD